MVINNVVLQEVEWLTSGEKPYKYSKDGSDLYGQNCSELLFKTVIMYYGTDLSWVNIKMKINLKKTKNHFGHYFILNGDQRRKFVQLKKNHTHHTGIKCTPYKAVFGIDTSLGLSSTTIPVKEWSKLETAKQLFDAVGEEELGDDNEEHYSPEDVFDPKEYQLDELTQR
ncbi:KRAB-A domain-containing 2-like [Brachionus plicatilis]|uniref:KRAB-A domain-containing 2-like n=1 Tax=Brachionus plicatilis TaxID=10195 RepID=A0A3M7PMW4_BRAPC|nr:KRAB-A domain-containing 2-like [Brachionus plicatilis]